MASGRKDAAHSALRPEKRATALCRVSPRVVANLIDMDFDFQPAPHEEAAAIIAQKPILAKRVFDQMLPELRGRVFTITGIESANVMQAVRDEIAALPRGTTWTDAKANIVDALSPYLGGEGASARATLLLRTHGFQAFSAADWRLAHEDEDTTHLQYLATEDDRVRATHLALNGIVLPKDDPFWAEHYPPWEWNCRCRVRSMNPDLVDMEREQDKQRPPEDQLVLEGPMLRKLREGTIVRGTRSFDVTPPEGKDAYRFHPENLAIPLEELKARYDPEVWNEFRKNAQATDIGGGRKLWDYLEGRAATQGSHADELHLAQQKRVIAVAHDANGQEIGREIGFGPSLELPPDITSQIEHGVLTVNHQSGLPPSAQDMAFANAQNLRQLRIVTPSGTWIVNRPDAGWPDISLWERLDGYSPEGLVDELREQGIDIRLVNHGEELA